MKKSNKGFTLIELLASVVLLGILFGLGIPVLTSMVNSNRDKIYVNDAKKLMSQAEYKIKAAHLNENELPVKDSQLIINRDIIERLEKNNNIHVLLG